VDLKIIALEQVLDQKMLVPVPRLPPRERVSIRSILNQEDKERQVDELEKALERCALQTLDLNRSLPSPPPPPTFTCFGRLPPELRLKIWDYATEKHCRERIHAVYITNANLEYYNGLDLRDDFETIPKTTPKEEPWKFVSNLTVHPALYVNRESRTHYISRTRAQFAFGTYINFETDIVFVPEREYDEYSEISVPQFLLHESSKHIRPLAMPNTLFCNIPGTPRRQHMSSKHYEMRLDMPE
jgi:hypothetical protein